MQSTEFNPDINETFWLSLSLDADVERIARKCKYQRLGLFPPPEDSANVVWCHSLVDPSYAPPGKHVVQNEDYGPAVKYHTEKEWLEIKKWYADQLMTTWEKYADNMVWDNVIGVDTNSPYDNLRMKNLAPNGCMAGVDSRPYQSGNFKPTPELANYRTPVKNFYATGACWYTGTNAGSSESYNCYKIIAKDMELGKPWEEPGKEEPDSLYQQLLITEQRIREFGKAK